MPPVQAGYRDQENNPRGGETALEEWKELRLGRTNSISAALSTPNHIAKSPASSSTEMVGIV